MSDFMQFYLTGGNSVIMLFVVAVILMTVMLISVYRDRCILACSSFAIIVLSMICTFAIGGMSHYEIVSYSNWQQIYPSKTKIASIEMDFNDGHFSQSLDHEIDSDTIKSLKCYQTHVNQDPVSGKIIVSDGIRKDERKNLSFQR